MNLNKIVRVSSVESFDIDEKLRFSLDKQYKNMANYKFSDKFEADDEDLPTLMSILVPFNSYHVIVTIHFAYGLLDLKVDGIITGQSQISDRIALCYLWFLGPEKVHYKIIDDFLGMDEDGGDPIPVDYLFVTEETIRKIFELLLHHYLGSDRPMYKCNPHCGEENYLDI